MESSKSKVKRWLKEPIFSKKIDPFLIFGLVVLSSIISSSLHQVKEMSTGGYMLWFTPCAILAILILKAIGNAWKNRKTQQDAA